MIRVNQLKVPLDYREEDLRRKAAGLLHISPEEIRKISMVKQSIDARKKPDIWYSCTVDADTGRGKAWEEKLVRRLKNRNISVCQETVYRLPKPGEEPLKSRPVIVGMGPAGLFCGLMLARAGYRPVLLERGEDIETRTAKVAQFWETGRLDPSSNVQFGEGGAGTFSDGKLNTLVKDSSGRNREVLRILTEFGADPSICYVNKPHIGTDVLSRVVISIRREIQRLGGEVRFCSQVTDLILEEEPDGTLRLRALEVNHKEILPVQAAVLAIGHSARDTFERLWEKKIPMEPKAFAVGLRVQHPQRMINESQYGIPDHKVLGPASYKVTWKADDGRGVYSFCMCPGGYVVNASSEEGRLAVNGMSYHDRDGENANSAIIVTVSPEDFCCGGTQGSIRGIPAAPAVPDALAGIRFQRSLEEKAFQLGAGKIPVQLYGDFKENRVSQDFGQVAPAFKGEYVFANLRELLPETLSLDLIEGMEGFGTMIKGFNRPDAVLAGIESRTSSPVRLPRNENMESAVKGLFPCGEGAGYAGDHLRSYGRIKGGRKADRAVSAIKNLIF